MVGIFDRLAGKVPQKGWLAALNAPTDAAGRPLPQGSMGHRPSYGAVGGGFQLPPELMGSIEQTAQLEQGKVPSSVPMDMPSATLPPTGVDVSQLPNDIPTRGGGIFDRIGDFVNSDQGRGALLRSGAATLQGGLGAGISAGANWMDQQKLAAADAAHKQRVFGLQQQGVAIDQQRADTDALYKAGQLEQEAVKSGIDISKLNETIRKNMAGERLDAEEMAIEVWAKKMGFAIDRASIAQREADSQRDYSASTYSTDSANRRHSTPSGSTVYSVDSANERFYNPSPKQGYTDTVVETGEDGAPVKKTTSRQYADPNEGKQIVNDRGQKKVMRGGVWVDIS